MTMPQLPSQWPAKPPFLEFCRQEDSLSSRLQSPTGSTHEFTQELYGLCLVQKPQAPALVQVHARACLLKPESVFSSQPTLSFATLAFDPCSVKPSPNSAGGGETFTNTRDLVAKIQASCSCRYNGSFPKLSPPFGTWYPRVIFLIMGTLRKESPYFWETSQEICHSM